MNAKNIFNSKLEAAENSFNSAFSVIENIQTAADNAALAAYDEEYKARVKRLEFEEKEKAMKVKARFYTSRATKIADFIKSLDD